MGDVMQRKQLLSFPQILFACIFFWIIALPAAVPAAVTLQWDPNDPAPEGYRLYKRLDGQPYNDTAVCLVTSTTCTVQEGLEPGMTYFFVVRAFIGSNQSAASNEVRYSVPAADGGSDVGSGGVPADPPPVNDVGQGDDQDDDQDSDDGASGGSNSAPRQPVLSLPLDGAENMPLTPSLTTLPFMDPEGDRHISSTFQISTLSDFSDPSSLVFDRTFTRYLTTVRIPDLILESETNYYWRVRFFDDRHGVSEWSDTFQFSTIDFAGAGDHDGNGIIDAQEFNSSWDIDANGIADVSQSGLLGVVTPGSTNSGVAITRVSENIQVIGILALDPAELPEPANRPDNMTGLISYKLILQNNTALATVKILFSLPAPHGAAWYQFDPEAGWTVCPNAIFSPDRKSVTLTLEDGGPGDLDGVQNSIIVDMAGLGYSTQGRQIYGSASSSSAEEARQCFIGTTVQITGKMNAVAIIVLAGAWMLIVWMVLRRQTTATA